MYLSSVCINESRYVAPELDTNSASEDKGLLTEDKYEENRAETYQQIMCNFDLTNLQLGDKSTVTFGTYQLQQTYNT